MRVVLGGAAHPSGGASAASNGAPRSVVVDVAGTAFGRGAHVHPRPDCMKKACASGLAKAFRCAVSANAAELVQQISAGCDRRIEGLLMGARRAKLVAVGEEAREAMAGGAPLAVVACNAGAAVTREYAQAIAGGRALAWKDKATLGSLLGRDEVAVVAVRDAGIAAEIVKARAVAGSASGK